MDAAADRSQFAAERLLEETVTKGEATLAHDLSDDGYARSDKFLMADDEPESE